MEYLNFLRLLGLDSYYEWVHVVHILSVITWMAGLFYLPRLYVYHAMEEAGSATSERFKVMERRLLKGIMNPSLIIVVITGLLLWGDWLTMGWMHVKLLLVVGMLACHGLYARWRKDFAADQNTHSHTFYRVWNEVPTVLLLIIVPLVVIKPF
ncbi:protoporphyrinogen oxidase HemJ [Roseospira goensis]|uniref:Protoporphyrinogen IX oxidase n=1 Tax=Roseospira goensis TaxID=391922 RepID=A0A7W6WM21_9PROT|nr:protoporphyrinogen oxidase HemJ [Roseospira goensis]MBB4287308.1 putative membrane protein [Roseospira goensis]